MFRRGMLDELLKLLVELSGLVIQRRHMCVAGHVLNEISYGTREGIEPIILSERALGSGHARLLIEQAVEGTMFPVNRLSAFDVLLDHRRTSDQTMLVHHGFDGIDDPLLLCDGAPVCVLHTTIIGVLLDGAEHAATVVGFAQNQLDAVLLGHRHKQIERLIVVAAQESDRSHEGHPAVKQLKGSIRSFVLAATL